MRLQERSSFTGQEKVFQVSDQWQVFLFPVQIDFGDAGSTYSIDLRFGYQRQLVEVAGWSLLKLSGDVNLSTLPHTIHSYDGRDADLRLIA